MPASYVALSAELSDLESLFPIIEAESQPRRQALFLEFLDEQFDSEYEEDLEVDDVAIEGERLIVEFQCSTELCNEITYTLFEGLADKDARDMMAIEYNSRVGMYTCMVPGYDEAEYIDECFDDFDGLMHELEDFMDRREQLLKVLEMSETDPLKSALQEYLVGEEDVEEDEDESDLEDLLEDLPSAPLAAPADDEESIADDRNQLMDKLKQAMADGDEERVKELFAKVQEQSGED